jgi:hypothetical protein
MIEGSLLKSNYLGKDGFIWWIGQVAPAKVWRDEKSWPDAGKNKKGEKSGSWAYRCKVRIIGYHPFDRNVLPDNDLPWAHVLTTGAEGAIQGGVGQTLRLTGGETAFGFFLDGDDGQQPVVVGCLHRNESVENFPSESIADQLRPFTGHTGPLRQGATQIRKQNDGVQGEPKTSNSITDIAFSKDIGDLSQTTREENKSGADQFIREDYASQQFAAEVGEVCIVRENGCNDNLIGKISKILQEFIQFVGRIQDFIGTYIDPILNEFVDIVNEIRGFARRIVGVVKFIINNLRGSIIKLVTNLFRDFIAKVLPLPQHPPVAEATKNIINIIFCLFEKLIPLIIDYIVNLLTNMIGKIINAPLCAVEEFTAAILGKLMEFIEDLLGPVMSGLNWLIGGIGKISNVLGQISSIAQQILNFIGCDQLKCETATQWCADGGASKKGKDSWSRTLKKLNFMKGVNQSIDDAIGSTSLFGYTGPSPFRDCSQRVNNPTNQIDKTKLPTGMVYSSCIPPTLEIFGTGINAQAIPIVGNDGKILTVEILNSGKGYTKPPSINVIDNTNNGSGAQLEAKIRNGRIESIYVVNPGSGYCLPDYANTFVSPTYFVTADKYTVFEGETINFTIITTNLADNTELSYDIGGDVTIEDLEIASLSNKIKIVNNTATLSVKVRQDSQTEPVETLMFNLYDPDDDFVAKTTIIIGNRLSPTLPPALNQPNESPPGTLIPDDLGGTAGIGTTSLPGNLIPFPGISTFTGIGTNVVGVITNFAIPNPGFGYTSGDTVKFENCVFGVIVTPTGAIVGLNSINSCNSNFTTNPGPAEIITTTGEGATIYPIIQFKPTFNKITVVNQFGVINVIDCITK